jgi:acyl-CoA thioester hydrolase
MPIEGEVRVRVRYAETDQMGIVHHANYFVWMEVGRVELCRSMGVRYRDMEEDGVLLTVAEVNCRYLAPAHYDEELVVKTEITRSSTRLVQFGYVISSQDSGQKLATGSTTHIFCGRSLRPATLPTRYWPIFGIGRGPQITE